jgi:hypothetical protein
MRSALAGVATVTSRGTSRAISRRFMVGVLQKGKMALAKKRASQPMTLESLMAPLPV